MVLYGWYTPVDLGILVDMESGDCANNPAQWAKSIGDFTMSIITKADEALKALGDNADSEICKALNNQALSSDSPLNAVYAIDQDWDREATYLLFDDGSRIKVSGCEVEVVRLIEKQLDRENRELYLLLVELEKENSGLTREDGTWIQSAFAVQITSEPHGAGDLCGLYDLDGEKLSYKGSWKIAETAPAEVLEAFQAWD